MRELFYGPGKSQRYRNKEPAQFERNESQQIILSEHISFDEGVWFGMRISIRKTKAAAKPTRISGAPNEVT